VQRSNLLPFLLPKKKDKAENIPEKFDLHDSMLRENPNMLIEREYRLTKGRKTVIIEKRIITRV